MVSSVPLNDAVEECSCGRLGDGVEFDLPIPRSERTCTNSLPRLAVLFAACLLDKLVFAQTARS